MKITEKTLFKGWLPVDDELDGTSEDEARLHLEAVVALVSVPESACNDAWSGVISGLHALAVSTQSAHWRAIGENFYSDHLLYQRMYEEILKEIDEVGEKFVGMNGDESILDPRKLMSASVSATQQMITAGDLASTLLSAQKNFLNRVLALSKILEASGKYTPGIENMLDGIIDRHEGHIYLLQRRVGGNIIKAVVKTV